MSESKPLNESPADAEGLAAGHNHLCEAAEPHLWVHDENDCQRNAQETSVTCDHHRLMEAEQREDKALVSNEVLTCGICTEEISLAGYYRKTDVGPTHYFASDCAANVGLMVQFLEQRVTVAEERAERAEKHKDEVIDRAVRLLSTGNCDRHTEAAKAMSFAEFCESNFAACGGCREEAVISARADAIKEARTVALDYENLSAKDFFDKYGTDDVSEAILSLLPSDAPQMSLEQSEPSQPSGTRPASVVAELGQETAKETEVTK